VTKPSVTAAGVVAVVLVAGIAAAFALIAGSAEPKALEAPPPDEVVVIYPDSRDPNEPIACMFELDCLMRQIEAATGVPAASSPPGELAPAVPSEAVPAA
jgi:hypothetical protein